MLSAVKVLTIPSGKAYPLASEFGIQYASSPFPSEVFAPLSEASVTFTGVPETLAPPSTLFEPVSLDTSFEPYFIAVKTTPERVDCELSLAHPIEFPSITAVEDFIVPPSIAFLTVIVQPEYISPTILPIY